MEVLKGRLGKEVHVDIVVERSIIYPDNSIKGIVVEPSHCRGQRWINTVDKVLNEDGVDYVLCTDGTKAGMINTVKHQKFTYVDLRK